MLINISVRYHNDSFVLLLQTSVFFLFLFQCYLKHLVQSIWPRHKFRRRKFELLYTCSFAVNQYTENYIIEYNKYIYYNYIFYCKPNKITHMNIYCLFVTPDCIWSFKCACNAGARRTRANAYCFMLQNFFYV